MFSMASSQSTTIPAKGNVPQGRIHEPSAATCFMPPAAETKRPAAPPEAMGWTACAEELSELRRECAQLGEIFDNLWEEMSKLRSDLTLRSEQYEQLRQTV